MTRTVTLALSTLLLTACASKPLTPWTTDGPPLVLATTATAGIEDQRGRFREIACAVIEEYGKDEPGYRPCDKALTRVGVEPGATGEPVELEPSRGNLIAAMVPGIGWDCFNAWFELEELINSAAGNYGYRGQIIHVEGLSGTTRNARLIRDQIMENADKLLPGQLVLVGYSKGAPDILEAIVSYPEIQPWIAAVVSVAGAVGGSPLANTTSEGALDLLRHVPKAECTRGDDEGVESLRPATRRAWLAANPLPGSISYYSVVTLPAEDNISAALSGSHRKLAHIDPRNDGQVISWDQVIPGSTLVGYLNADHWAVAVPISETHPWLGKTFANHNAYPWRAVLQAVLRFVEEDLDRSALR
ncbi:MAG: hypothetical protein PVI83_03080 [Lysobacterales bacterium]|jgi:hypothetical protein